MGFFDGVPVDPAEGNGRIRGYAGSARDLWPAYLAGDAGVQFVMAHSAEAAVAVTDLRGYPGGFVVTFTGITRRDEMERVSDADMGWRAPQPLPDALLRLGVRFAGGGMATSLDGRRPVLAAPEDPDMEINGGTGAAYETIESFLVTPLPPPGPLAFVCEWPAFGIPETTAEIDAAVILECAARAERLWDS